MDCKFHPLDPAMNYCDNCEANYCEACSDESAARAHTRSRADQFDHRCFVCGRGLTRLIGSQAIPPFWTRLSEIYRYPITIQALSALVVVSFFTALLGNSSFLLIAPSVAMMMYSFACLRETTKGNLEAPGLEACIEGSIGPVFYVIIAFIANIAAVVNAFNYFGTGVGILVSVFFGLAMPAVIIIIASEEKLAPAMNPLALFSVMKATGASYFVMLLFIIIMVSSVAALQSLFYEVSASFFGILLQSLIANYYGVVIFHIMGYLVYQNQQALGFKTSIEGRSSVARPEIDRIKSQLEVLIKAGEYQNAGDLASKQLKQPGATLWDWSRAFSLICVSGPNDKAKVMFNDYANKLESAGETDKLATAYLQLKRRQPKFVIKDHEQRLFVANTLFETGQYSQVVNMLHKFHQESDDNKRIIRALKLLSESLLSIPGREKLANQYQALYQMQLKKT